MYMTLCWTVHVACGMVVARTTIIIVSRDRIMNGSHVFRKPPILRERGGEREFQI